ncbi:MAG: fixJ [Alphaproteobacteria bacterium]|nr:fixJ [Alphaproteobacteria bacterium]MDB5740151.1 fixJ [Alphaproteobacteria bacterium]
MNAERRLVVWIVDDAVSVRKSIGAVLETADITVRDYGSAGEFLADFAPAEPSCLIVDHHMPDMTGLELLLHLRQQGITVPVIVITGQGDPILKEKALKAGAVTMLHKPVDGDELITLIETVMADTI